MKLQKVGRPTSCCIWSPQNQRSDSASGRRGCIAAGYPRKARENKRSHTDSISPSLAAEGALDELKKLCLNSLSRFAHCLYGCHVLLVVYTCT